MQQSQLISSFVVQPAREPYTWRWWAGWEGRTHIGWDSSLIAQGQGTEIIVGKTQKDLLFTQRFGTSKTFALQ